MYAMTFSDSRHDGEVFCYATQWQVTTLDPKSVMRLVLKSEKPLTLPSPVLPHDLTVIRQAHHVTFCTEYRARV